LHWRRNGVSENRSGIASDAVYVKTTKITKNTIKKINHREHRKINIILIELRVLRGKIKIHKFKSKLKLNKTHQKNGAIT